MRIRNTVVAATGALLLVLAVPTSSTAATGDFLYKVGSGTPAGIADPTSGECINLPGTTEEAPGFAPDNTTTSSVKAFLDFDCNGDTFYVMDPGKKLGDDTKIRSVVFD
ncbi:hypothetical protein [Kitasatospora sp. NPDC058218]|uniref:hypothetical protein n=1 Tax=Kitasatospora sp. NPDC058218 TaxID=3346385 RepID=UPI0036DD26F6